MGLLDEAIREHLELKRRRGADPAEVAREQREALEPAPGDAPSSDLDASTEEHALEGGPAPGEEGLAEEHAAGMSGAANAGADPHPADAPESPPREHQGNLEETAELDMNAVLQEEHSAEEPGTAAATELATGGHGSTEQASAPSRQVVAEASEVVGEVPGQARIHFEPDPPESSSVER
jgi:hypothetical protein